MGLYSSDRETSTKLEIGRLKREYLFYASICRSSDFRVISVSVTEGFCWSNNVVLQNEKSM